MQKEKIRQAAAILKEKDIDLWMTVVRETIMGSDPVLPFIATIDFSGTTALCITSAGRVAALVSSADAEGVRQTGLYDEVIPSKTTFDQSLVDFLKEIQPRRIALNYSPSDYASDGLSHGMYLRVLEVLDRMGYGGELISSLPVISALRGRKSAAEKDKVRRAAITADQIFHDACNFIRPGISERDIYDFFFERMTAYHVAPSWEAGQCPAVFSGPDSVRGHTGPTGLLVKPGHFINIDFGVVEEEYCSDLQRGYYVLQADETRAPAEVQRAFETIQEAVRRASQFMKAGVTGNEVDKVARDYVTSQGYPSWDYALGHQVGRAAHDGGTILGPRLERYNHPELIDTPLEIGNIFTLELGVPTSHGWVGLEEMVSVQDQGVEFLVPMQPEIYLIQGS